MQKTNKLPPRAKEHIRRYIITSTFDWFGGYSEIRRNIRDLNDFESLVHEYCHCAVLGVGLPTGRGINNYVDNELWRVCATPTRRDTNETWTVAVEFEVLQSLALEINETAALRDVSSNNVFTTYGRKRLESRVAWIRRVKRTEVLGYRDTVLGWLKEAPPEREM